MAPALSALPLRARLPVVDVSRCPGGLV